MYVGARCRFQDQFNEPLPLPLAFIELAPCECCASIDPEPLPAMLRLVVDGTVVVAAGAEA